MGCLDREMTGIVSAGGDLIYLQATRAIKKLDGDHAHVIDRREQGSGDIAGIGLHRMGHGSRRQHPVAHLLVLVGLHQGVALHVASPVAAGELGELLLKVDKLLKNPVA